MYGLWGVGYMQKDQLMCHIGEVRTNVGKVEHKTNFSSDIGRHHEWIVLLLYSWYRGGISSLVLQGTVRGAYSLNKYSYISNILLSPPPPPDSCEERMLYRKEWNVNIGPETNQNLHAVSSQNRHSCRNKYECFF